MAPQLQWTEKLALIPKEGGMTPDDVQRSIHVRHKESNLITRIALPDKFSTSDLTFRKKASLFFKA